MNEKITEDIVRTHFKSDEYYDKILFEEQKSSIPRVDKLLKNASKSGLGGGKPEFLITFKNERPDLIIVIECKASRTKHESKTRDNYKEYAVDGVLLYSSFLSQVYDVLSIAVSGEDKNNVKISHFIQLKGGEQAKPIFGNDLLPVKNYIDGYINNEHKRNQEYQELLKYAKPLNEHLHSIKVKESQRSLLISGILIALEDESFEASYTKKKNTQDLANLLVNTIKEQLGNALKHEKSENLAIAYSFIKTHTDLSQTDNVLVDLIRDVNEKIKPFIKTYPGQDILGQFYIEFLQYSNNDKSLGIVLTPPHITEFFSDIAMVDKNSVLLDNCTGTAGFLISGMKKMVVDANGDAEKIKNITKNQLLGIERDVEIFALACSNMYIHGDGKSNIERGSCFDEEIIERVKTKHPNVGFLNPPYRPPKAKNDRYEYEFILNNLSMLEKGGTCVTIIPMSCVLAQSGKELDLKTQLLESHTLEAVLSMPDELFVNSNVGTITCIMVIKAHQPHPANYETYFGYCKDDGFIKRKPMGRGDYLNRWNGIKEQWLYNFRNRKEVDKHSIKRCVTAEDEWCAEAYMETDYSNITKDDFIESIKKFVIFQEMNLK